ncbi:MAG: ribonuclease HI [Planctomycetes bacterium]|nr:ribonuclease HI [Planctomycetota bacterium]
MTSAKSAAAPLIAYTDGGCRGNPGPGGWAFLLIDPASGEALERTGGEPHTTNNRMEYLAAIEALRALKAPQRAVRIHSDSNLLIQSVTEWMPGWKAKGWKKKGGPLKNLDLLQELDRLVAGLSVTWQWVPGHAGVPGNERVDQLTNEAMDRVESGSDPNWEQRRTWRE